MEHHPPSLNNSFEHFVGFVETTTDALRLIMAARQGIIPRITRRLNDSERRSMIKSGSVFVFCVEESGIKRWTEGLSWSPSRIVGNFLVYREVTERSNIRGSDTALSTPGTSSFHVSSSSTPQRYRNRSEAAVGRSADTATMRPNGLIKKTITVKVEATDHHLVSYYKDEDVRQGLLQRPIARPDIMALSIPPEMVRATNFRHPPHVEVGPDGTAHIYDAEEADPSRRQLDRASASPTSQSSYPALNPTPQLVTSSEVAGHPQGVPARPQSVASVQHRPYDTKVTNDGGASRGGLGAASRIGMRPAYRWPPPSPMPLRSESPRPQDTAAAQGVRASQQVPSRYAAPGLYYQQSQGRAQPQAPVPSQPYAPQAAAMANKSMYYAPYTEQHSPDFADRSSASAFSSRETGNPFPSYPHSPAMRSYHADVQGPLTGPELTAPAPGSTAWGSHTDSAYDTRRPSRDGDRGRREYYSGGHMGYAEDDDRSLYHGEGNH